MRHHNKNKKFGRKTDQRRALMRSLVISLLEQEKIETTEAKAKALRSYVEKIITKAKDNNLSNYRLVLSKLGSGASIVIDKLFKEIAPRYKERQGGYTRIVKKGQRVGSDGADMAIIELIK